MPRAEKKGLSANTMLALGLVICAVVVVVAIVASNMMHKEVPPPPPPPPPAPESSVTQKLRYSPSYYKGILDEDTQKYGIPSMSPEEMARPLVYVQELAAPKRLKADKDKLETPHLLLHTKVSKLSASSGSGGGFSYEHALLEITNRSDKPIAYRIDTALDSGKKCSQMGAMGHNAIALAPGEKTTRTECLWTPGMTITVKNIEVIELNTLSYYYVSRLMPNLVLMDERTALGHTAPKGKLCSFIPAREMQAQQGAVQPTWADVVDFYARHNCDEYSFWRGYTRWTAPGTLPSIRTASPSTADGGAPASK